MSSAVVIKPDLEFTECLIQNGGQDLRKCYQCATCSVTCELSSDSSPFPRKEMIWAQWGLKERVLADPDVWLCHNCNDCSERCPRGAKPGDVLAAMRRMMVQEYSIPGFLTNWVNRPAFLPLMMLIPALLLAFALTVRDPLAEAFGFATHHGEGMQYANLFPHWLLIGFFTFFLSVAVFLAVLGIFRFWCAMNSADIKAGRKPAGKSVTQCLWTTFRDILTHQRFGKCKSSASRKNAHLGAFYGFLALFLVSGWAVILLYVINPLISNPLPYPFPFLDPAKIIANIGAVALIVGCLLAIKDRMGSGPSAGHSTDFDWMFLGILLLVGITGILVEALRYAQLETPGYIIYFVHLVLAFMLLIYLPYSKLAHLFYRTTAMVYAEYSGRTTNGVIANGDEKQTGNTSA